jgi:hypothetical protein
MIYLLIVYFVEVNQLSYIIWSNEEGVRRVLFFPSLQLPNRIKNDPLWQFYQMDEHVIGETTNCLIIIIDMMTPDSFNFTAC